MARTGPVGERRLRPRRTTGGPGLRAAVLVAGLVALVAGGLFVPPMLGGAPAGTAPASSPPTSTSPKSTAPTSAAPAAAGTAEAGAPGPTTAPSAGTSPWSTVGANADAPGTAPAPEPTAPPPGWASIGERCAADDPYTSDFCFVLGTTTGAAPTRTIYTLGNSHTVQLSAALLEAVDRRSDWALRAQASPGCPFSYTETPSNPCEKMWTIGTKYIKEKRPDLVVVMATRSSRDGVENLLPGLTDWVRMITTTTRSRVVVVRDSPRFSFDMHRCAVEHGADAAACTVREPTAPLTGPREALEAAGAIYLDLTPYICPGGECRPAVGGVWTYMDDNHLGADFWRTLAAPLSKQLAVRIPWWPANPYAGQPLPRAKSSTPPIV